MWSSRRLPFVCIVSGSRGWLLLLVPVLFCYPAFQWFFLQQFVNRKSLPSFWFNICSDTMQLCPSYSIMWYHSKMHFLMSPGFLEMGCIRGRRWCLWREYLLSSAHVMLGEFGCSFLVCSMGSDMFRDLLVIFLGSINVVDIIGCGEIWIHLVSALWLEMWACIFFDSLFANMWTGLIRKSSAPTLFFGWILFF